MRKLRIRYNLGAICVVFFGFWGSLCALAFCGVMWYLYFGFVPFTQKWTYVMLTHTMVWGFMCPFILCYQFLLLHITCYMFGLRLDRFLEKVKQLKKNNQNGKEINLKLKSLLQEYLEIVKDIQKANEFWSKFLGIAYFIYITNFTILLFDSVFANIPIITKWMWGGFVVCLGQILAFMSYSGDIVSRKVK